MRGLQSNMQYTNFLTAVQRETFERLAEIEKEDADRCANCGGEDCICCEYYHDRQRWSSPEEMLAQWNDSLFADEFYPITYEGEEEEWEE